MSVCDVLVIGAGPAGGAAALAAAQQDVRVLIADRKAVVGVPVRCAEHIPTMLVGCLPIEKSFIVQSIRGMKTHLPGEAVAVTRAP